MRRGRGPATRAWVHLDQTPLFDQANGTKGVANVDEAGDDPRRDVALKLLEVGLVSSIITFGTGLR